MKHIFTIRGSLPARWGDFYNQGNKLYITIGANEAEEKYHNQDGNWIDVDIVEPMVTKELAILYIAACFCIRPSDIIIKENKIARSV